MKVYQRCRMTWQKNLSKAWITFLIITILNVRYNIFIRHISYCDIEKGEDKKKQNPVG
jgi:hypothetical protein